MIMPEKYSPREKETARRNMDFFLRIVSRTRKGVEQGELAVKQLPKGNWAVFHKGDPLCTVAQHVLDPQTVEYYKLDRRM